ncbi:MAG: hypothetical protein C5B53_09760 [Candidatus Melainabacteria bacterium]|nr:MAG: hypothetical protein C5B53_09760 [Candidatus Melainabacteria bacterium]
MPFISKSQNVLTSSKRVFGGWVAKTFMTARNQHFAWLLVTALTALSLSRQATQAAENDGSLDTVWADSAKTANSASHELPSKESGKDSGAKGLTSKGSVAPGRVRPICSVNSLINSGTIVSGGWPGVGPFKAAPDQPYDFSDVTGNHLKLTVDNNEVNAAEIVMASGATPKETLIKLEVTTDFLLEGLGVKPAKINQFNLGFEKATARVKGPLVKPIGVLAPPLAVVISPTEEHRAKEAGAGRQMLSVIVNAAVGQKFEERTRSESKEESTTESNPEEQSKLAESRETSSKEATSTVSENNKLASAEIGGSTGAPHEDLKKQFLALIQSWQGIKKKAVRQCETAELAQILAGKALARQIAAISWLKSHHKYCDVVPKSVSVEQLEAITPDKTYSVHAVVKETTKYFDQNGGQLLKEINDVYHVIYTVEKVNDQWLITDTAIVKTASPAQQPPKPRP